MLFTESCRWRHEKEKNRSQARFTVTLPKVDEMDVVS